MNFFKKKKRPALVLNSKNVLPLEIWAEVLSYLSPKELIKMSLLSTCFNELTQIDYLWKPFCKTPIKNLNNAPLKNIYIKENLYRSDLTHHAIDGFSDLSSFAYLKKEQGARSEFRISVMGNARKQDCSVALRSFFLRCIDDKNKRAETNDGYWPTCPDIELLVSPALRSIKLDDSHNFLQYDRLREGMLSFLDMVIVFPVDKSEIFSYAHPEETLVICCSHDPTLLEIAQECRMKTIEIESLELSRVQSIAVLYQALKLYDIFMTINKTSSIQSCLVM